MSADHDFIPSEDRDDAGTMLCRRCGEPHGPSGTGEWRWDVPHVPARVTALSGVQETLWLRQEAPRGFAKWPGSWWASQHADGSVGPTAHLTDIVSHAPLVEAVDPRAAS